MLETLFGGSLLNVVYTGVLGISFLFAILSLIGAEIGEIFDFGFDGGEIDFISLSPFSMAMFGGAFGFTGLVTRIGMEMGQLPSLLWAVGVGLGIGVLAQLFFIYVLSANRSTHYSLSGDVIGLTAEVIITIPPDGQGKIMFNNPSGRVTLGARSATGKAIANGVTVDIERIVGRVAHVRPAEQLPESIKSD